ncbi:MAG: serine hydrolase domain-containing protein, partial [Oscillibacter sp.]
LALMLVLCLSIPAQAAETLTPAQRAEQAIACAAQYGEADSIQYALWESGKITRTGHAGTFSRTENRALTDGDLYGVGSISKMYTTAAMMKLVQQGSVQLDLPVTHYLPQFKMADARYKEITVRMLLNHSSGLMGSSFRNAFLFGDADSAATDALLDRLATQRLKAAPGAYSVYCNDGFTLAQLVVEAVSGMKLMDYVETTFLAPAGLKNTYAPGGKFDTDRLARIYPDEKDTRALPAECLGVVGAGGIYATASDLAAFGGQLASPGVLNQSSLSAMAAAEYDRGLWPDGEIGALSYGLGWDNVEWFPFSQNKIQALVKGGDTGYYHAGLVVLPEYDMAVAVLSSGGVSIYNELAATQILIDALAAKGVSVDQTIPPFPAAAPAAMPAELTKLGGDYGSSGGQYRVDVSPAGELSLSLLNAPDVPAQKFAYYSDGSFRNADNSVLVKLVPESDGQTYFYQQGYSPVPQLGALPGAEYAAVKLAENTVTAAAQTAWDDMLFKGLVLMNEKYSSQTYLALSGSGGDPAELPKPVPGYAGVNRIVDETRADFTIQCPGTGSRDGQDMRLTEKDGVKWLTSGDSVYMELAAVPMLFTAGAAYTTVQSDGYARWYGVDAKAAGRTMTVQLPKNSGFYVYDGSGKLTASSLLWGDTGAVLPADGLVVFAGDPGAQFQLDFAKK